MTNDDCVNVIFLDFDGVLNSVRSAVANLNKKKSWTSYTDREWSELDPVAIGLVNRLCREASARVVISSTWRMNMSVNTFNKEFAKLGCEHIDVVGMTQILRGPRGNEIEQFLQDNPWINNYVILDDSSDMLDKQMKHFVHISLQNGMLLEHYREALRILCPFHSTLIQFDASTIEE